MEGERQGLRRHVLTENHRAAEGTFLINIPGQVRPVMTGVRSIEMIDRRMTGIQFTTGEMNIKDPFMRMRVALRLPEPANQVKDEEESGQQAHRGALWRRNR